MCAVSSATSASGSSTPAARSNCARLLGVHAQVLGPELQLQAPRPQRAERQRGRAASRQGELRAVANVSRERGHRVEARAVVEQMQVVQDQHERLVDGGQRRAQPRHDRPLDRRARRRQRLEHAGVDRRDAVERGRDIRQQDDRIVVLLVDVHPRERPRRARGPLGQQRRLSPARAGGQEHDRNRASRSPRHRSALRVTPPRRGPCGGSSFDSSSSNAGAGRSRSLRLRRAGADFTDGFAARSADDRRRVDTTPSWWSWTADPSTATILVPCPPETRAGSTLSDSPPCQGGPHERDATRRRRSSFAAGFGGLIGQR